MPYAQQRAAFAVHASYGTIAEAARQQLKIRALDGLGCALGAMDGQSIRLPRVSLDAFGGNALCTRIGGGRLMRCFARRASVAPMIRLL